MTGKVFLIGAGPGDVELLTLKAVRCLGLADLVLIDDLASPDVLRFAAPGVEVIHVGKRCGAHSAAQHEIEALLVDAARAGRVVARVKGGDPFIFGRGGEEMLTLRAAGIDVAVINGITSGSAVPATLGIPLTHRHFVHGVTFVSGHSHKDGDEPDWARLAQSGMTLVVYMGLNHVSHIADALIAGGLAADTPAAAIQYGTRPEQRQALATLATLADAVKNQGIGSPALLVIGRTVSLADAASFIPSTQHKELT
ncbi:MAG: uroporphyrinogen-III C-methyltransferase [Paludibacterium sp.]|uniref:uroporphyrinogen-III C-methyltransferase n=1 Tax=Paludibacterium sp. TaxID=1917523 RepID=UPI0025E3F670|nr:uroporphyrinogen-III C-methyltransferase [Paludibacterium sp.]MBV8049044.1 uroporphyrinogen-III C-methyltransferase [Paludibacterium sp.]MBV8649060.1 uroporphyrinogen-III C-methyltransferase [Paludibacterium sp.]